MFIVSLTGTVRYMLRCAPADRRIGIPGGSQPSDCASDQSPLGRNQNRHDQTRRRKSERSFRSDGAQSLRGIFDNCGVCVTSILESTSGSAISVYPLPMAPLVLCFYRQTYLRRFADAVASFNAASERLKQEMQSRNRRLLLVLRPGTTISTAVQAVTVRSLGPLINCIEGLHLKVTKVHYFLNSFVFVVESDLLL